LRVFAKRQAPLLAVVFTAAVMYADAKGQATEFTGAGDGVSWTDPANWDNGEPNDLLTGAVIDGLGTFDVQFNTAREAGSVAIGPDDRLSLTDGAVLDVDLGILSSGEVAILSGPNVTGLGIVSDTLLAGSGSFRLSGSNAQISKAGSAVSGHLTIDGTLVHGQGQIGANDIQITNDGVIRSDINGATLIIDPGAGGLLNKDTIEAINGSTLQINDGVYSTQDPLFFGDAFINAVNGSSVNLMGGAHLIGGVLTTDATGSFHVTGNTVTLEDVQLERIGPCCAQARVWVDSGNSLELVGQFVASRGQIRIEGMTQTTDVRIESDVTIFATNEIESGIQMIGANARILDAEGPATGHLTNNASIWGQGMIGADRMQITNNKLITAGIAGTTLTIDPNSAGLINTGTMQVVDGAVLQVTDGFPVNDGVLDISGGGEMHIDEPFVNGASGSLKGQGTLRVGPTGLGDMVNRGKIFAGRIEGGSDGRIIDPGLLTLDATSSLEVSIDNFDQVVAHDRLTVLGDVLLGGELSVTWGNREVPTQPLDPITVLAADSLAGSFSNISSGARMDIGGISFIVDYSTSDVVFHSFLFDNPPFPLQGDLNGDGFVGIADLGIVLGNWNLNVPPGDPLADPSGDGFVGIDDLGVVLGNWNAGTPPTALTATTTVPEPATMWLIALGGLIFSRRPDCSGSGDRRHHCP
jgi:PEP-CTERM motif